MFFFIVILIFVFIEVIGFGNEIRFVKYVGCKFDLYIWLCCCVFFDICKYIFLFFWNWFFLIIWYNFFINFFFVNGGISFIFVIELKNCFKCKFNKWGLLLYSLNIL